MDDLGWKFGDVIENRSASHDNPERRGYFVRVVNRTGRLNPGRHAELTDGDGKIWLQPLSGEYLVRVRNSTVGPRS